MKEIPKHIHKKLLSIFNHQYAVKKIVDEIEVWANIIDVTNKEGWSWGMNVDIQGNIETPESNASLLQDFIALRS